MCVFFQEDFTVATYLIEIFDHCGEFRAANPAGVCTADIHVRILQLALFALNHNYGGAPPADWGLPGSAASAAA